MCAGVVNWRGHVVGEVARVAATAHRPATGCPCALPLGLSLCLCGFGLGVNLCDGLGSLRIVLSSPASVLQVNQIHDHESRSAGKSSVACDLLVDALEVSVEEGLALLAALEHSGSDRAKQSGQVLNSRLIGVALEVEQTLNTLVHNTNGKHTKLVKLADELDETETASLCGSGDVVLVRHELNLGGLIALGLIGQVGLPTALELLLTAVEQVLAEESTTDDGVTVPVLDGLITNLETHGGQHLVTELGVHTSPVSFVTSLLEGKLNNLAESATVGLVLGLGSDLENLVGNSVELLGCHLVERGLHLTLNHVGSHVSAGVGSGGSGARSQTASDPSVCGLLDRLEVHASGERHLAGGVVVPPASGTVGTLASTTPSAASARLAGRARAHGRVVASTHATGATHAKVAGDASTHAARGTRTGTTSVGCSEALL